MLAVELVGFYCRGKLNSALWGKSACVELEQWCLRLLPDTVLAGRLGRWWAPWAGSGQPVSPGDSWGMGLDPQPMARGEACRVLHGRARQ